MHSRFHNLTSQNSLPLLRAFEERMGKSKKSKKSTIQAVSLDVSKLVEQGQLALDRAEPELALKFFERAHSLNSSDTSIMDSLADVLLQLNEPERAYELLNQSISLEPLLNPCKYLYLAQLQTSHDALKSYQTGISFLNAERSTCDPLVELYFSLLLTTFLESCSN